MPPVPESRERGQLIVAGFCGASLGAAGLGAVSGADLSEAPVLCPFRLATGLPCPFCGLTRSVFAAGQGRWEDSLALSPLGLPLLVLAPVVLVWIFAGLLRGGGVRWPRPALAALALATAVSWTFQLSGALT
jgi:hypothetical protein